MNDGNEKAPAESTTGAPEANAHAVNVHADDCIASGAARTLTGDDRSDVDVDEAQRFLTALDPDPDARFGFRVIPTRGRADNKFGTFNEHADTLVNANERGAGVFVVVNALDGKGQKETNVERVRAVFADLDDSDTASTKVAEARQGARPPHVVVESSPGKFHLYWLVNDVPLDRFREVQGALAERFDGDASIIDPPRVMRLPGFMHRKGEPFRSRIVHLDDGRAPYSADEIHAGFVEASGKRKSVSKKKHKPQRAESLPDVIDEGGRDATLTSFAGVLRRRGLDEDEILVALSGINDTRCRPKLTDRELRKIAHSIGKRPLVEDEFVTDDKGRVVAGSQHNVRLALAGLGARPSYDEFADHFLVERDDPTTKPLDDARLDRLWLEIDATFAFRPSKEFFRTVVFDAAREATFHPVRDYLASLKWDGTERIDSWLVDYAGADDTRYARAVGALLLVAAVRRVRHPGAKFDELVVFESPQGTNKSSALATMCPDERWFSDDLPLDADGKIVIERTAGKWLVEAGELSGMRRSDVERLKGFLSRWADTARLAYARHTTTRERHFVVVGTTNDKAYLKDSTGNRRFWPVQVSGFDLDRLRQDRDQLWAEAATREAAGESIRLDPTLWRDAAAEQNERRVIDPWEETVAGVLASWDGKILAEDVWRIVGRHDPAHRTQVDNQRLGQIMARLGFERKQLRHEGERRWHYVRGTGDDASRRIIVEVDWDEFSRPINGTQRAIYEDEIKREDSRMSDEDVSY